MITPLLPLSLPAVVVLATATLAAVFLFKEADPELDNVEFVTAENTEIEERDKNQGVAGFLDEHLIALEAKLLGKPYRLALPVLKQFGRFHFHHLMKSMCKVYTSFSLGQEHKQPASPVTRLPFTLTPAPLPSRERGVEPGRQKATVGEIR